MDTVTDDDGTCSWSLISDGEDGTFTDADKAVAQFIPETGGGVYRFSFACGSLTNSEAVLVLPLSWASVDDVMTNVLAKALLPEKHMSFEDNLLAVCLDGLVTNYPALPLPQTNTNATEH